MKMNNERIFRIPLRPFTIYWSKSFTQESHPGGSRSSYFLAYGLQHSGNPGKMPSTGRLSHILGKCSDN